MSERAKILLVDDQQANLVALEALLRDESLEILTASSGTAALELLLVHEFALALVDVQMPEMDGFELAELMRGAERGRRVPIIFVTAGGREPQRVFRGYESGAVDFLFKPIEPMILRHKVATFVELHRQRRQLAEQLLRIRESEELLRAVFDSTSALILVKDVEGRYVSVNSRFASIFGSGSSMIGRRDAEIFSAEIAHRFRESDLRALETGNLVESEEVALHPDGSLHTYLASKVALRDADDRPWAVCCIAHDITDRRRLQSDLEQAVRTREDILAVVSHDLRDPLGVIGTTASLLARRGVGDADELRKHAERIRRSVHMMTRMIGDLMDMANIRAGRLSMNCGPELIDDLLDEAVGAHEASARERGVTLERHGERTGATVQCDRLRLQQVFANLIGNAVKFCAAGASVSVRAVARGNDVEVSISDEGPGIPEQDQPRVFDAYWSGGKHRKSGSGLGLYITKAIVDAHGGRISLESTLGKGTTVRFTLPATTAAAASVAAAARRPR